MKGYQMINIENLLQKNNIKGLSYTVVKGSNEITTHSYGVDLKNTGKKQNKLLSACSISRLLTTVDILQAKDEGILDLNDDVNKYLKSWHLEGSAVTTEDLLLNQSGIVDCEASYGTYKLSIGKPSLVDLLDGKTIYVKKKVKVVEHPRKSFVYSDNNFLVLEKLLEDLYDMSYRELVHQKILKPFGMEDSSYLDYDDLNRLKCIYGRDKLGNYIKKEKNIYPYDSVAGLWTTSNDLSKLLAELFKSYNNESDLLLKTETTKEMMSSKGCVDFTGYGVFVYEIRGRKVFHSQGWGEGFQSYMLGFLEDGDGIVVMMNQNPGVDQMDGPIGEIVTAFVEECFSSEC
ncbi:MAG: beta-lactamase family protein [Clostridiales bacterium]|nr:beta-lactamase family protein [Clostridiales bacterium]